MTTRMPAAGPHHAERRVEPPSGRRPEAPAGSAAPGRTPRLRDISLADWRGIVVRAGRETLDDNVPMMASALAYSAFFAIPSALLVVLGVFSLVADQSTITSIVDRLTTVAPSEAATLFGNSLQRVSRQSSAGITLTVVGLALAVWSMTSSMSTVMTALNVAYDQKDSRGFVRRKLTAFVMAVCVGAAALLAGVLLIMGPHLQRWVGDAIGARDTVSTLWWIGQWPILVAGFLVAFAVVLAIGPDAEHPRWQFFSPGAVVAVLAWLAVSGAFSVYTSRFGSYDKTWGSLSAVIVTLIWLWLAGLSLLFGGELNAETSRSGRPRDRPPDARHDDRS